MKKNFARVNEKFDIGIDGAEGKWTYTPTDKYTHVIRYFSCFVSLINERTDIKHLYTFLELLPE